MVKHTHNDEREARGLLGLLALGCAGSGDDREKALGWRQFPLMGVFNEEQRRTLELELPSQQQLGMFCNQLDPRVGGTFQPAQPAQLPVPPVFVPPMQQVQQMQQQVGHFCGVPGMGRFGPGPMNVIGAPCFVGPYQGSVTF
jgi:hypothetical protein